MRSMQPFGLTFKVQGKTTNAASCFGALTRSWQEILKLTSNPRIYTVLPPPQFFRRAFIAQRSIHVSNSCAYSCGLVRLAAKLRVSSFKYTQKVVQCIYDQIEKATHSKKARQTRHFNRLGGRPCAFFRTEAVDAQYSSAFAANVHEWLYDRLSVKLRRPKTLPVTPLDSKYWPTTRTHNQTLALSLRD